MTLYALLITPLVAGIAIAPSRVRRASPAVLLGVSFAVVLVAMAATLGTDAILGGGLFVTDGISRLFVAMIDLLFFGIAAHAVNQGRHEEAFRPLVHRLGWVGLPFLAFANLAVLSNSLVLGWAALEITTLLAAVLVADDRSPAKIAASWQYFLFSSIGLAVVLAGFTCLQRACGADGSLSYDTLAIAAPGLRSTAWAQLGVALIVAGYGTKLGLFPMNTWLPVTYAAAPAPVTALLGSVQFNCALVGLLRIVQVFRGHVAIMPQELLWLGMLSMAVSTFGIVTTRDYARLLGYAAINHAGVIAFGLALGPTAAYGVLLYVVSNAFIKAILFLTAGRVQACYGTTNADSVRGLIKAMPFSGVFLMIGTFALLGLPPFGSFLGELMILSATVTSGRIELVFPFCAMLAVSFAATGRTVFPMIWGDAVVPDATYRDSFGNALPKAIFLVALVALGVYIPSPVNAMLRDVAVALGGE